MQWRGLILDTIPIEFWIVTHYRRSMIYRAQRLMTGANGILYATGDGGVTYHQSGREAFWTKAHAENVALAANIRRAEEWAKIAERAARKASILRAHLDSADERERRARVCRFAARISNLAAAHVRMEEVRRVLANGEGLPRPNGYAERIARALVMLDGQHQD